MLQSDAVSTQTTRVQRLKEQAATGKVSVAKVEQEESVLAKMTVSNHLVSFTPCSCFTASTAICMRCACTNSILLCIAVTVLTCSQLTYSLMSHDHPNRDLDISSVKI